MRKIQIWHVALAAAALTLVAGYAAGTGGFWAWPLDASRFGATADWVSASVNAAIVGVTLHLADRARRDAQRDHRDARTSLRAQALGFIELGYHTVQNGYDVLRREAGDKKSIDWEALLECSRELIVIERLLKTWEKKNLDSDVAYKVALMLDVVERAEIFMRRPPGPAYLQRNAEQYAMLLPKANLIMATLPAADLPIMG